MCLTEKALSEYWMNVLALWAGLIATGLFAFDFLRKLEFIAALFLSPFLGFGAAILVYVISIPIGKYAAGQILQNLNSSQEYKTVRWRRHEDLFEMFSALFGNKSRSSGTESNQDSTLADAGNSEESRIEEQLYADEPSRTFRHARCDSVTRISGDDLIRVSDPFTIVLNTYCAGCEDDVDLDEVFWEDSGESISDYRIRMRAKAPIRFKLVGFVAVPVGGLLVGYLLSLWLLFDDFLWNLAFGALGAFCGGAFITPYVLRWMGADYATPRKKRKRKRSPKA